MHEDFSTIEYFISRLEETNRSQPVMASIAWSQAMRLGADIVRLHRIADPEDSQFIADATRRCETAEEIERRMERAASLVAWAVRGANPEFVPSGEAVADRLQSTELVGIEDDPATIDELAEEMDATTDEVRQAIQRNQERLKSMIEERAGVAQHLHDQIVHNVDLAIASADTPDDQLPIDDAISLVNRMGDKVAAYSENLLAASLRQRRARRRRQLAAERRLLLHLEEEIDATLDRLERERDAVGLREEPAEA